MRDLPEKDKLRTVDLSKISCPKRLCNLHELRKNWCTRDTFHYIATLRVEGNYVKTRKINLRIFHANGKKEEVVEEVNSVNQVSYKPNYW